MTDYAKEAAAIEAAANIEANDYGHGEDNRRCKSRVVDLEAIYESWKERPAWHARPTSPGWWILKWNDGNYRIMHFREHELKSIAGWVMRCYGPIPEPPEMPT